MASLMENLLEVLEKEEMMLDGQHLWNLAGNFFGRLKERKVSFLISD